VAAPQERGPLGARTRRRNLEAVDAAKRSCDMKNRSQKVEPEWLADAVPLMELAREEAR
jgi:hypothetical protein